MVTSILLWNIHVPNYDSFILPFLEEYFKIWRGVNLIRVRNIRAITKIQHINKYECLLLANNVLSDSIGKDLNRIVDILSQIM